MFWPYVVLPFVALLPFVVSLTFDPMSFDPLSFDPVSFDPLSGNLGSLNSLPLVQILNRRFKVIVMRIWIGDSGNEQAVSSSSTSPNLLNLVLD